MNRYGMVGTTDLYMVGPGLEHTLPPGAVPVAHERPTPDAVLQADGTWGAPPPVLEIQPEPLDLNAITFAQADAIMRADTVEGLRLAVLDVLGV